jgi:molybdopterin/thiamine biosynthesis adenylyltransferase
VDPPADAAAALAAARRCDVVLDASGDAALQFLANDAALAAGRPLVHAGVLSATAQLLTVRPGETGCLRCLFEAPPPPGSTPTCAEAGVLGPLAGFAGALLGAEALRLLAGERGSYAGRLLVLEARRARWRTVPVAVRADCPACRPHLVAAAVAAGGGPHPAAGEAAWR